MYYYSHNIGDFDRATRHLTRLERSIYRDLLDVYYDTEAPLTLDRAALCRKIIARSNEEATAVEQVLNEFFIETERGWFHSRCEDEIAQYRASNSQKSAAGKASAAARAARKQQALDGNSTAVGTGVGTSVATDVEQTSNGSATKQEPITSKRKPEKQKGAPSALPDWLPAEPWAGYLEMRKRIKKVPTDLAIELVIKALDAMRHNGQDIAAVLNKSITNNWTDVYPIREERRAVPERRESRHTGFEALNYQEGISDDGKF